MTPLPLRWRTGSVAWAAFSTASVIFVPSAAKSVCKPVIRDRQHGSGRRRTSFSSKPSCWASLALLILASRIARHEAALGCQAGTGIGVLDAAAMSSPPPILSAITSSIHSAACSRYPRGSHPE